ncbi:hypothetical protein ACFQ1I_43010 [Kitasatospora arboriphila]
MNTAYNLGGALGSAAGGLLADRADPAAAFTAAAVFLGGVTALVALRPSRLRDRAEPAVV